MAENKPTLLDPTTPMSRRFRILVGLYSPTAMPTEPSPDDTSIDSDPELILFIGLIAILCFLLCFLILNAVARCSWIRWCSHTVITTRIDHFSLPAAKLLRTIPKLTYSTESMADKFSDCAICLTEFVVGDEIRVLPMCGHCFHVVCIDRWIGSHFTCPSCRQMLLKTTRCDRCQNPPVATVTGIPAATTEERGVTVNRWIGFGSHFTCPSCRQMLKTSRCDRCQNPPVAAVTGIPATMTEETSVTVNSIVSLSIRKVSRMVLRLYMR